MGKIKNTKQNISNTLQPVLFIVFTIAELAGALILVLVEGQTSQLIARSVAVVLGTQGFLGAVKIANTFIKSNK